MPESHYKSPLGSFADDQATCGWEMSPEPCMLVIFGASGDLTRRKLIPALYHLFICGGMPDNFCVVGAARSGFSEDDFRDAMRQAVMNAGHDLDTWDQFAARLFYQQVHYDNPEDYQALAQRLESLESEFHISGGRIFNLALPPSLYGPVATLLGKAKLNREDLAKKRWSRLVVEKPFWPRPALGGGAQPHHRGLVSGEPGFSHRPLHG